MLFTFIIRVKPVCQYPRKVNFKHGILCNTIQAEAASYTNIQANFIKHNGCARIGCRNHLDFRGQK